MRKHPLSTQLSDVLLQEGAEVLLDDGEMALVMEHNKQENVMTVRLKRDGSSRELQLDKIPLKITVAPNTGIQCSELVGHFVEVQDEDGKYRVASVRQFNVNVAANLLRFLDNDDKEWVDMATKKYKLVNKPSKRKKNDAACVEISVDPVKYENFLRITASRGGAAKGAGAGNVEVAAEPPQPPQPQAVKAGRRGLLGALPTKVPPLDAKGAANVGEINSEHSNRYSIGGKTTTDSASTASTPTYSTGGITGLGGSSMTKSVDTADEEQDDEDEDEDEDEEDDIENDLRKIEIESYVYHHGQKKMKKSEYTRADLYKKMESNPKYAADWKKLIDQFERKWRQQRKIFVESYVYQSGKKTMKKREYTVSDLEEKKASNPKYAGDWQKLINQFELKWKEQNPQFKPYFDD